MPRKKEKDVAPQMPRLTFDEAAKTLGVPKTAFMEWLEKTVSPKDDSLWQWATDRRPLPEKLIRLYLTTHRADAPAVTPPSNDGALSSPPDSAAVGRRSVRQGKRAR